ncbi:hypothetical protein [Leptospira sarikeiensis]|uniref:DUF2029 domain-containing protein n=1 Tax=Leptospira sarikeiensis TaxID=2484943 RepID=A0A4R9K7P0_9LEPT|nr:hypothetical protein [Leptospira sarikeiensis]TGL61370.1 hypothetical protein EHQ64_10290 [Leptospira sarikeiensis]
MRFGLEKELGKGTNVWTNLIWIFAAFVFILIFWFWQVQNLERKLNGPHYLIGFLILSFLYVLLFFSKIPIRFDQIGFYLGVFLRLFLVFLVPIFEDDWARYLWDGWVIQERGTPYGISPDSFFGDLDPVRAEILSRINHPDWPTIYGPVLEIYFYFSHALFPWKLWALKLFLIIPDLILYFLIRNKFGIRSGLLYFWNPILLKEIFLNAHPDILGVAILFFSIDQAEKGKYRSSFLLWGLSLAVKGFGIVVLPYLVYKFWKQDPDLKRLIVLACHSLLGFLLPYLPFLFFSKETDFLALTKFLGNFSFFPLGYTILLSALGEISRYLWAVPSFVFTFIFLYKKRDRISIEEGIAGAYFLFFLFSPVVNAWYLLWVLPFLFPIDRTFWPSWILLFVGQFSYLNYANMGNWRAVLEKGYYAHPDWLLNSLSIFSFSILGLWFWTRFYRKSSEIATNPSPLG